MWFEYASEYVSPASLFTSRECIGEKEYMTSKYYNNATWDLLLDSYKVDLVIEGRGGGSISVVQQLF